PTPAATAASSSSSALASTPNSTCSTLPKSRCGPPRAEPPSPPPSPLAAPCGASISVSQAAVLSTGGNRNSVIRHSACSKRCLHSGRWRPDRPLAMPHAGPTVAWVTPGTAAASDTVGQRRTPAAEIGSLGHPIGGVRSKTAPGPRFPLTAVTLTERYVSSRTGRQMDRLGGGASFPEDLGLRNLETLEDLGDSLRRLRRRYARRRSDALLSYRYLAEKTGYAHGVIGGYFSGKVLPPPDKLDVIVVLLGADSAERLAFAAARDAIEERRRRPAEVPAGSAAGAAGEAGANGGRGPGALGAVRTPAPATAASSYLYDLLTRPGRYRTQWRTLLVPGKSPVDAISEVIARTLGQRGSEDADQDPVKLRGRISRALAGNSPDTILSSATLSWFVDAFDIAPDDADRLRFLHAGSSTIRYVRGDAQETDLPIFDAPPA